MTTSKLYGAGLLLFGTLTAMCCGVLEPSFYYQPGAYLVAVDAVGVLLALTSLIYFRRFHVTGNFVRFSFEYWLIGATCYMALMWIVIGLEVSRMGSLPSIPSWIAELSATLFPRAVVLLGLGMGIIFFGCLLKISLYARGK